MATNEPKKHARTKPSQSAPAEPKQAPSESVTHDFASPPAPARGIAWRSTAAIPVRPATEAPSVYNTTAGRVPLLHPRPSVPGDAYMPKAFDAEVVPFRTTAFREGHDKIGVHLRLISPAGDESLHRMSPVGDGFDTWEILVQVLETGIWHFRYEAFTDEFATWQHAAALKIPAGVDVTLMREIGARLFTEAAQDPSRPDNERRELTEAAELLRDSTAGAETALAVVEDAGLTAAFAARPVTSHVTFSAVRPLQVERTRAGVGAWYEFFPRSEGATVRADGSVESGTFRTAIHRLPAVADMGFTVLYLPPIHPIGVSNRKGRNNTLEALAGDPGSPWAIGGAAGGHDTVHPELGTLADFRAFVAAADALRIEVALDFALQASPDHPWVTEHPEWFTTLPDGTIAYAENPPKKYQDIYPINFDNDPEGIRNESLRIIRHWIAQGVRIFRVDNPHTKPLQFWEWLIATINAEHSDIVFLAEAFSRPNVMRALAAAGFQQSYSYFTWRNTKEELQEFLTSVSTETADFMRPNLFVNTPDILTEYLQFGGRPAYKVRAAIAATSAPSYGVYAGYELYENVARPGAEENIDNEKFEFKLRDWAAAEAAGDSLAPYLRMLNRVRADHPALAQLRNIRFHWSDDDAVLVFSKHLDAALTESGQPDTIIVVANVDPHSARETTIHLDTRIWGVEPGESFEVEDLVTGAVWTWEENNFVRLDAFVEPVHILHVRSTR